MHPDAILEYEERLHYLHCKHRTRRCLTKGSGSKFLRRMGLRHVDETVRDQFPHRSGSLYARLRRPTDRLVKGSFHEMPR